MLASENQLVRTREKFEDQDGESSASLEGNSKKVKIAKPVIMYRPGRWISEIFGILVMVVKRNDDTKIKINWILTSLVRPLEFLFQPNISFHPIWT